LQPIIDAQVEQVVGETLRQLLSQMTKMNERLKRRQQNAMLLLMADMARQLGHDLAELSTDRAIGSGSTRSRRRPARR